MFDDVHRPAAGGRHALRRGDHDGQGMRRVRRSLANLGAGMVASIAAILAFVGAAADAARPELHSSAAMAIGSALVVCAWGAFRASRVEAEAARECTGWSLKDLP